MSQATTEEPAVAVGETSKKGVAAKELEDTLETVRWHALRGEWHRAMALLKNLRRRVPDNDLPGVFHSLMGHAVAHVERDLDRALELCRAGVEQDFFRGDAYWSLASVLLLTRNKSAAHAALRAGLELEPNNPFLRALHREMGVRRPPVLSFLPRRHPLNVFLGRLRHGSDE